MNNPPAKTQKTTFLQNLRQLADEIRVKIHLAGMDAKDTWSKLEPRLREVEQKAEAKGEEVAEELSKAGQELKEQMSALLGRLRSDKDRDQPSQHRS